MRNRYRIINTIFFILGLISEIFAIIVYTSNYQLIKSENASALLIIFTLPFYIILSGFVILLTIISLIFFFKLKNNLKIQQKKLNIFDYIILFLTVIFSITDIILFILLF